MGGGTWTNKAFATYSTARGLSYDESTGAIDSSGLTTQSVYRSYHLQKALNPLNVVRECCDSDEHPNTVPVILALDVTGSMGATALEVATKLNVIMTELYDSVQDVEFMVMGIGDFYCDDAPLQVSQFESDIRIAEQLEKVWFEGGGGGNNYESYTAAWAFAADRTKLDCWSRGKKGLLITIGDEPLNPYIDKDRWVKEVGDTESTLATEDLYRKVSDKYDVYHIHVDHGGNYYGTTAPKSFAKVIGEDHVETSTVKSIAQTITAIVNKHVAENGSCTIGVDLAAGTQFTEDGAICW